MCRNIKPLFNFDPVVTDEEVQAASLQFVRKITGMKEPSKENQVKFDLAVNEISIAAKKLLVSLEAKSKPKNREIEAQKAKARSQKRFQAKGV